jgi:AraC-like DNA-binding protein
MSVTIHRRNTTHSDQHEITVQGPELDSKLTQFEGTWHTISARSGFNISVFDFVAEKPMTDTARTQPCVSLIFIFGASGQSWIVDKKGNRHGPISHRPGRFYLTYAPEPVGGINEVPGGVRSYGLDIRISIEIWQRIIGEYPGFCLNGEHPFHAASCDNAWIGMLPVSAELRRDARMVFDLARAGETDLIVEARSLELVNRVRMILTQTPEKHSALARDRQIVQLVLDRIAGALDHDWSVAELAKEAGVSLKRLKTVFPAHTGLPVFGYLQEARLNEAQHLLEANEMKVTDVALTVGYSSSSHFSALFKRRFGLSPKEFKQRR